MKDKYEKITKQSYISFFLNYCMYFYDIRLMHLLIDEIGQLGIITVYTVFFLCSQKNHTGNMVISEIVMVMV